MGRLRADLDFGTPMGLRVYSDSYRALWHMGPQTTRPKFPTNSRQQYTYVDTEQATKKSGITSLAKSKVQTTPSSLKPLQDIDAFLCLGYLNFRSISAVLQGYHKDTIFGYNSVSIRLL